MSDQEIAPEETTVAPEETSEVAGVQEIPVNLAPNDPARVPAEHREFINKMIRLFKEENMTMVDVQATCQALSVLMLANKPQRVVSAMSRLYDAYPGDDMMLLKADLEVFSMTINAAMNATEVGNMDLKEV